MSNIDEDGILTENINLKSNKRKKESRALKKAKKLKLDLQESPKHDDSSQFENFTIADVMCPICLSILVEPVTMPCRHTLCLQCFDDNVTHTAYTCPLCRIRIGVWKRKATKTGTLVNFSLWNWIQEHFKEKLEAKNNGNDSKLYQEIPDPLISAPGEIGEEFEKEQKILLEELQRQKEKEEKESEVELKRIEEEAAREREAVRILCKDDREFAKKCREEQFLERKAEILGRSPLVGSKNISKLNTLEIYLGQYTPKSNGKKKSQQEMFFKNVLSLNSINNAHPDKNDKTEEESGPMTSKNISTIPHPLNDITQSNSDSEVESQEYRGFRNSKNTPNKTKIGKENKFEYDGDNSTSELKQSTNKIEQPNETKICEENKFKYDVEDNSSGDLKQNTDTIEQTPCMLSISEKTIGEPHPSTSTDNQLLSLLATFDCNSENMNPEILASFIEDQRAEEGRLQQEKDDAKFAFNLQKSMTKVDRRKGSEDEYSLRTKDGLRPTPIVTLLQSPVPNKKPTRKVFKVKTPKVNIPIKTEIEYPKFRQTTIMETLSKRRLSEEY